MDENLSEEVYSMQTNQNQSREDVEEAIVLCKENITELRHNLRWFNRFVYVFWSGVFVAPICFISVNAITPYKVPVLNYILQPVGVIAVVIAILATICICVAFFHDGSDVDDLLTKLGEEKQVLKKLVHRLEYIDDQALRHITPEQYIHRLPTLIQSYRKQADSYRNRFITIQIITIFLSATITSLSGGWLDKYILLPWIIPVLGFLISVLTSFTLFFKLREKGTNLQQTADAMDWEHMACTLGIGKYTGLDRIEALRLLATTSEDLRKEQQKRQLQLEQSSHVGQKALQESL